MARIRTARRRALLRVIISGRLTSGDMGRFEHACAPALVSDCPRLELDLGAVTLLDQTASVVVERFAERGVRVIRPRRPVLAFPSASGGALQ